MPESWADAHAELERIGDAFANLTEWRPQVARRGEDLKAALVRAAHEKADVREGIAAARATSQWPPGDVRDLAATLTR